MARQLSLLNCGLLRSRSRSRSSSPSFTVTDSSDSTTRVDVSSIQTTSDDNSDCTSQRSASVAVDTSSDGDCQCLGCSDPFTPYQPSANLLEKQSSRKIQPSWFQKYPWLSVCSSHVKLYCCTCRTAKSRGLLTFSKHYSPAFVDDGFKNLKKALQKFRDHECSIMHQEAVMKVAATSDTVAGIDVQLCTQLESDQQYHRRMLMKLLRSIRLLARQGLPFRGHREDIETTANGNFLQLLLFQAQECPELDTWLRKKDYISPDIVNEIITMMGNTILRSILNDIKNAMWYSLIADEATDVSHHEQLSLSIRWVDKDITVHEDTLGLFQLPNTKSTTLFHVIKDILIRCSLSLSQCRGQAFDGASNMSGIRNGVQALVKSEASKALYVHCLAHSLNLCLKDSLTAVN